VQFSVTLLVTEQGEALAGEVGVIVGTERMHSQRLDRADVEVPADMALRNALRLGREYLDVRSSSNGEPTPPQPKRSARKRATPQGKGTTERGVSRSRLR
jgi:hypothetical protein